MTMDDPPGASVVLRERRIDMEGYEPAIRDVVDGSDVDWLTMASRAEVGMAWISEVRRLEVRERWER